MHVMSVHTLVSLQQIPVEPASGTLVRLQQILILVGSTTDNWRLQQILVSQQHMLVEPAADSQRLQQTRTGEPATDTGIYGEPATDTSECATCRH